MRGLAVEKLAHHKFIETASHQEALQTIFLSLLNIFYHPIFDFFQKNRLFQQPQDFSTRIRLGPILEAQVLTAIAASRTPLWLPSGWGCRGRRLSKASENPRKQHGPWPCARLPQDPRESHSALHMHERGRG